MNILLSDLFDYDTGNLPALELTEDGPIPLVYGTTRNNGVIKMVKVYDDTKVFTEPLITVSYLGTAFVQTNMFTTSFVDKSNITILRPKETMSLTELYFYCYQINKIAAFGFNYGRRMNQKQLNKISLIKFDSSEKKMAEFNFNLQQYLPAKNRMVKKNVDKQDFVKFPLNSFFDVVKGSGAYKFEYEIGKTPLVSATSFNNGILDYVDTEPTFSAKTITVERIKGNTFVQLKPYSTIPDDISVLIPKDENISIPALFYFAYIIRLEAWRYSYGRKLSPTRLKSFNLLLPVKNGVVNFEKIDKMALQIYGWKEIIKEKN